CASSFSRRCVPSVSVKLRIPPTWSPALPSSISLVATSPPCQVASPLKSRIRAQTSSADALITVLAYDFAIRSSSASRLSYGASLRCSVAGCARLGADLGEGLARRQRLGVDRDVEHRDGARTERAVERGGNIFRPLDALAVRAECTGEGDEVRVVEVGAADATGEAPLLVHADRPVHTVVEHDHDHGRARLLRRRELLRGHQEVAVAGEAHDVPVPR